MRTTHFADLPASPAAHDHLAWLGDDAAGFARTARRCFAAAPEHEMLVLVGDGSAGELADEYAGDLAAGRLVTMNALETYAPVLDGGTSALAEQLARFDSFLDDALGAGYSALRVVADNTAMLAGTDEQARNWLAWEQLTDRWQALRPVNGNCYFDTSRIRPERLRAAQCRHPVTVGADAPWRLFYEQDDVAGLQLVLAGAVETFELAELVAALRSAVDFATPGTSPLALSLRDTEYLHHTIPFAVSALAGVGCGLRVTEISPAVGRLLRWLPPLPGFPA